MPLFNNLAASSLGANPLFIFNLKTRIMKNLIGLVAVLTMFLFASISYGQTETLIKRINCGGAQVTGADGLIYEADTSNSDVSYTSNSSTLNLSYVSPLAEPYRTFRYMPRTTASEFNYTFNNLQNGEYKVILHFAEPFHGVQNSNWNTRRFDIDINNINNGVLPVANFNIMSAAAAAIPSSNELDGARKVYKLVADNINITGNSIIIKFTQVANDPMVNAIEVFKIEPSSIPVIGVSLNTSNVSLEIGATQQLTASVSPNNASNQNVSWSSSDTSIVTVNSGLVTAVAEGNALITVTTADGGFTSQTSAVVTDPNNPTMGGNWSLSSGNAYRLTGNVGIGTTNPVPTSGDPNYKLAVKGKIRAEEIKVETGWADYVFFKDYKLPTLEEVEKHIQEQGHLINIPSAAEVEANGIELGEMNKLLLEKVEELTLYIIEMKHEINELKKE